MKLDNYLEIADFSGQGYRPLIDYQSWRVAVLRYIPELQPERIDSVECHQETDEVFILVEGKCILFVAEIQGKEIQEIHAVNMEPRKLYNVRKGTYHNHVLSENAHLIIVENQDTNADNSRKLKLDPKQRDQIMDKTQEFWSE